MRFLNGIRNAIRSLRKSPGYTLACIVILALGIGANTAIFSLIDSIILKPLPYPDSERLVFLWESIPSVPEPLATRMPANRNMYRAWQSADSFASVAAFLPGAANESGVHRPRRLSAAFVSSDLLPMLGARPVAGRLLQPDEEQAGRDRIVIVSYGYFTQRFNRDANAIGKSIRLDDAEYTVIGVLPDKFRLPATFQGGNRNETDVFIPLSRRWTRAEDDYETMLFVAAKLKPNVAIDQARAEISTLTRRVQAADPGRYAPETGANVFSFEVEDQSPGVDRQLYLLLGAVVFFLLIACTNLANLTLARATNRTREIAIQLALGATRARISRELLAEAMLLSVAGAFAGLFVAGWIVTGLLTLAPDTLNRPEALDFRWPVFLFTATASVSTTILFGLLPALTASRTDVHGALKSSGYTVTGEGFRSRQLLTAAEVAIALVLLTGAGLLIRTVVNLVTTGIGIDMNQLAVVDVDLSQSRYPEGDSRERFLSELVTQARLIQGVTAAGITTTLPLHRIMWTSFSIEGRPEPAQDEFITADHAQITPGYLRTIGIPVIAGRGFTNEDVTRDRGNGNAVVLINQALADKFFAGEDPLGRRLVIGGRHFEIAGVTANFRALGPTEEIRPQFFRAGVRDAGSILVVRTPLKPESLTEQLRQIFWTMDKEFPAVEVHSMQRYFVSGTIAEQAFNMLLLGAFAVLGLVLAMMGVYSILAHLVASRRREIGIRIALGASRQDIARMAVYQSLQPVVIGLIGGLTISFVLSRLLETMLFQVSSQDPLTFILAALIILLAVPVAIWIPARRAMSVECTVALRGE